MDNLAVLPDEWIYETFGSAAPASVYDRCFLIISLTELGRFAEAAEHAAEAIRLAGPTQQAFTVGWAHWAAGEVHLKRGDLAKARPLLDHATAVTSAGNVALMLALSLGSSAWVLAQLGEINEALSRLREGEQLLVRNAARGHVAVLGGVYSRLRKAALILSRLDKARRPDECAVESSSRHPGFAAYAQGLLGDVATHDDSFDAEQGEVHYRNALALADPRDMRPLVAHCHLGLGKLYRRTANPEQAQEHLTTAMAMCREMGMIYWVEQAEAELHQLD
jgi:tetratricopeptide (TPR) repeat protein